MQFTYEVKESGSDSLKILEKLTKADPWSKLSELAERGVSALADSTPRLTGATASSWDYDIRKKDGQVSIVWTNSEMAGNVPLAILLQYGHGTRQGGYVEGIDFINPATRPVFEEIAIEAWRILLDE